jgi:hypothetical protein
MNFSSLPAPVFCNCHVLAILLGQYQSKATSIRATRYVAVMYRYDRETLLLKSQNSWSNTTDIRLISGSETVIIAVINDLKLYTWLRST